MIKHVRILQSVSLSRLHQELKLALGASVFDHVDRVGNEIYIFTKRELIINEQVRIDEVIAAHQPILVSEVAVQRITAAIEFGNRLVIEFAADNVALGITQAGKTKEVVDYCNNMLRYIQSGSLYEVIHEVDALINAGIPGNLAPFVTQEKLEMFKQKIIDFLT